MEYTKGDWKVSHPLDNVTYFGNEEGTIAKIQWFTGITVSEQKANAQLIASAPDLYEALGETLSELNHWAYSYEGGALDRIRKLAVKALAKAGGK